MNSRERVEFNENAIPDVRDEDDKAQRRLLLFVLEGEKGELYGAVLAASRKSRTNDLDSRLDLPLGERKE